MNNDLVQQFRNEMSNTALIQTRQPRLWDQIPEVDRGLMKQYVSERSSTNSFRRYFKSIAQFMMWFDKPLHLLSVHDLREYQHFLSNPSQAFLDLPEYAFRRLQPKTIDSEFDVLKAFCKWLAGEDVVKKNPAANVLRHTSSAKSETRNYFTDTMWATLQQYLDSLPTEKKKERHHVERFRYCIHVQYGLALRAKEMANHNQSHLYPMGDKWKIAIVGKGNKERIIPVPEIALDAIIRYNRFLGLPGLPNGQPIPLLPSLYPIKIYQRGPKKGMHIKNNAAMTEIQWQYCFKELIKGLFRYSMKLAADVDYNTMPAWSKEWSLISPHALRHTRATHLFQREEWDLMKVMKFLGHGSPHTTQVYYHLNIDD